MTRRYREVDAAAVPARSRQAAEDAVRFASMHLGIARPEVRWFVDCPPTAGEAFASLANAMTPGPPVGSFEEDAAILGRTASDELVWLRADLGARRTAEVALHEVLHVYQHRLVGPAQGSLEYDGREAQARAYETDLRGIAASIVTATREGDRDA
jgi:hypothetical protein